jgi:hypothetical protein
MYVGNELTVTAVCTLAALELMELVNMVLGDIQYLE